MMTIIFRREKILFFREEGLLLLEGEDLLLPEEEDCPPLEEKYLLAPEGEHILLPGEEDLLLEEEDLRHLEEEDRRRSGEAEILLLPLPEMLSIYKKNATVSRRSSFLKSLYFSQHRYHVSNSFRKQRPPGRLSTYKT